MSPPSTAAIKNMISDGFGRGFEGKFQRNMARKSSHNHNAAPAGAERLADVDWDFPQRVAHSEIEGIHPYPAKFVAEIPRALLEILKVPEGTAVLDPFCGSGTTLVECQRRGIASVGVDLNPIACLMTRVKTAPLVKGLKGATDTVVTGAQETCQPMVPDIPNLDHWFYPEAQKALAALSDAIASAPAVHRDALRLALSSIIVRVSKQDSDTRYAAVEKEISEDDVYSAFVRAAYRIQGVLEGRNYPLTPTKVIQADTLTLDPSRIGHQVGMVITSPPYPNAYEYWLYHKYRMYWLGFDPIAVKAREIGARAHFFKRNHHTAAHFVAQMTQAFQLFRKVLAADGHVCFLIGRSRIHGQIIDNASNLTKVASSAGFERVFERQRLLSANRKSFNLSHANIKTESVIVFRQRGKACA